jgi:hypothetical protein
MELTGLSWPLYFYLSILSALISRLETRWVRPLISPHLSHHSVAERRRTHGLV